MDNNKDKKIAIGFNQKVIIFWIIVIIVIVILISIFSGQSSNGNSPTPTPTSDAGVGSTLKNISQADQARMKEIITGVMQNTIQVTQDLKNEIKSIFVKYNATDAEISDFATYGPAFAAIYQGYFFVDALKAVSSGISVKSSARANLETEALARGLITPERIKTNDEEMELIATHQPVTGSNGKQVIFTTNVINSTINNIAPVLQGLNELFTTTTSLNSDETQPTSNNNYEDNECEKIHGPSVYKTVSQSDGGGAYCDCKPGYTSKIITTADGTPSSWCTIE